MKRLVLVTALALCTGCSVLIQNRYSVLGIDVGDVGSPSEATFWSAALLIGVAVVSALLAVLVFWLGQRWLTRRRMRAKEILLAGSIPPVRAAEQGRANAVAEPAPEGVFTAQ